MGTIAEEITRIQTAKSNIKTAIENKGVAVGDITIDGYAEKINQIVGGSGSSKWVIPDGTSFQYSTWTTFDGNSVDTSNMTTLKDLFRYCSSLTSIEGTNTWNVSNVRSALRTFDGCTKLTTLDLANWNASNCVSFSNFLNDCYALQTVNLFNMNTSGATDFSYMFKDCDKLSTIYGINNLDVTSLENAEYMFGYCSSLTSLDLSSWIPPTNCSFNSMFYLCITLTDLNVSSFDFSNTNMAYFIYRCGNLINFNCGKNIKTSMDITGSPFLSVDSIMSIINNYYDYTANGQTTSYYLKMTQAQADKLTDEQKAVLTNKGVSFSIS